MKIKKWPECKLVSSYQFESVVSPMDFIKNPRAFMALPDYDKRRKFTETEIRNLIDTKIPDSLTRNDLYVLLTELVSNIHSDLADAIEIAVEKAVKRIAEQQAAQTKKKGA